MRGRNASPRLNQHRQFPNETIYNAGLKLFYHTIVISTLSTVSSSTIHAQEQ